MEFNRKTIITFPDDTDIPDITTGIVSGSLSLDEVLCEKNLNFGEFNASSFSAQLYYDNNIKGKKIQVYQLVNNEKIAIFTGIIDSCVRDDHDYFRDLIAYDEAYAYRNTNVAKWWASFWGTHTSASLKLLRNDLLKYMGITYIAKDLPNDDLQLTQSVSYDTLPFGDVLQYICQLSCCFPHMNRIGTLEFLTLDADTKNYSSKKNIYCQYYFLNFHLIFYLIVIPPFSSVLYITPPCFRNLSIVSFPGCPYELFFPTDIMLYFGFTFFRNFSELE